MALPIRRRNDSSDVASRASLGELQRLNRQLTDLLDQWEPGGGLFGDAFVPLADIEETSDAYQVEIELSGVKREDVNLEISGRRLTVSGDRKEKERAGILRRRERVVGRFQYEVTLPGDLDEKGVEATLDDGVLTVRVPKAASDRPRRIEVRTAGG